MRQLISKAVCMAFALMLASHLYAQDLWDRHSVASCFYTGDGTEANPYQIRTGAELMYFVGQVNAGNDFSGKTVKLMNDIDMNNDNFCISQPFAGTFDGGGHFLTMMMGVSSDNQPFMTVSGRIHHLGLVISMANQYKNVYYGYISIVKTLKEDGILEDCHYMAKQSASIFYYQPALAYSNYGIIRNCFAGGLFNVYGGYSTTDGSQLVRDNYETGIIENCYATVNGGRTHYYYKLLPLAYTDKGIITHNSTVVDELNQWVDEHPGHSRWTESDTYKLVDFNPGAECAVEFIDTLFSTSTPALSVTRGQAIGELPIPDADCTFLGWERAGQLITPSEIVNADWTLFAKWAQRIKKQPGRDDMSVEVDDAAHASYQWYAIYGEAKPLGEWASTNSASNSVSSETITFEAKSGQQLQFIYYVSSEAEGDFFTAYLNETHLLSESGEKTGSFEYTIPEDGTYKLVLRYEKDDDTSKGLDKATVYNIHISSPSNALSCTQNGLASSLIDKEGVYFCKISYSNTTTVLFTDSVFFALGAKCATPTISYYNGKLTFMCETEGVEFVSEIKDADIKKNFTSEVDLTVTYNISVYATKEGYGDSEVATATLCWIDVVPEGENIVVDVAEVRATPVLIQSRGGVLTIDGVAEGTDISVYDTAGRMAGTARATGGSTTIGTTLRSGEIGIVNVGGKAVKLFIR